MPRKKGMPQVMHYLKDGTFKENRRVQCAWIYKIGGGEMKITYELLREFIASDCEIL